MTTTPGPIIPSSIAQEGICNMALGHLKITRQIAMLATDQSAEAVACRTFYGIARQKVLEDFKWPFATIQGSLALLENNPLPYDSFGDSEFQYAYEYPSNCVNFVRVLSGIRNESRHERVPFKIFYNPSDNTQMILTDMYQAVGEWTVNQTTEDMYKAAYVLALSYLLASLIAPMLTGGDPFKLGDKAEAKYNRAIIEAQANALNEEQMDPDPESEFVLVRGYMNIPWSNLFRR